MRLIDADKLKTDFYDEYETEDDEYVYRYVSEHQIDEAPSIDIVRCGECKWGKPYSDKQLECDALGLGGLKFPDDFCSYGCRSEIPNNSTISKMEQVETMSCAECKHRPIGAEICEEPCHYEPQTDWHYDEQDATWYPYKHEDEPQQKSCATCKHALGNWDGESNNCGRCCGADRRFYEPRTSHRRKGVANDTSVRLQRQRQGR